MSTTFTTELVWQFLHRARPLSGKPLPKKEDETYRFLAIYLNDLEQRHAHLCGQYREQCQKRKSIAEAVATLADLLPEMRDDYQVIPLSPDYIAYLATRDAETKAMVEEGIVLGIEQLAAFEGLVLAVNRAKHCGLPALGIESLGPHLENETVIIQRLDEHLSTTLPNLGVGERHRFIAETIKQITGNAAIDQKKIRQRLEYRVP